MEPQKPLVQPKKPFQQPFHLELHEKAGAEKPFSISFHIPPKTSEHDVETLKGMLTERLVAAHRRMGILPPGLTLEVGENLVHIFQAPDTKINELAARRVRSALAVEGKGERKIAYNFSGSRETVSKFLEIVKDGLNESMEFRTLASKYAARAPRPPQK